MYIRDDRRQGTLSLCEVEVKAQAGKSSLDFFSQLKSELDEKRELISQSVCIGSALQQSKRMEKIGKQSVYDHIVMPGVMSLAR